MTGKLQILRRPGDFADRIFNILGEEILSGKLTEGQKLSEPELAQRFGTSRGPIREAIRRLAERRMVVHQPNLGAKVTSFSAEQFIELYYVREAMEGMAARLAAIHITDAELAELAQILIHQQAVWIDREPGEMRYRDANRAFHDCIINASRNETLVKQMQDGGYQLSRLWRRQYPSHSMRGQEAIDDHSRILHALEQRDPELAEMLMRRHIASTRKSYERIIAENGR